MPFGVLLLFTLLPVILLFGDSLSQLQKCFDDENLLDEWIYGRNVVDNSQNELIESFEISFVGVVNALRSVDSNSEIYLVTDVFSNSLTI